MFVTNSFPRLVAMVRAEEHPAVLRAPVKEEHQWWSMQAPSFMPQKFTKIPDDCSSMIMSGHPSRLSEMDNASACPMFHGQHLTVEDGERVSISFYNLLACLSTETRKMMAEHVLMYTMCSGLHAEHKTPIWNSVFGSWALFCLFGCTERKQLRNSWRLS